VLPAVDDSFSSALIRCDMLEPILPDLGRKSADEVCCVSLWRNAAPEDTVRADVVDTSAGDSRFPRVGLDTARGILEVKYPLLSAEAADRPVLDLLGDMIGNGFGLLEGRGLQFFHQLIVVGEVGLCSEPVLLRIEVRANGFDCSSSFCSPAFDGGPAWFLCI
jgi:hypothetical protein